MDNILNDSVTDSTEKFPWLIVNNIKEQTTPSSKICQEERHTKVLTNVWAHHVFKCLACVDTMRVMNTNCLFLDPSRMDPP